MKSNNHQDPIQDLANRLREHAVPYREGAWEQFKAQHQKKKAPMLLWPYFSAAAVMLLALTLFWPMNEKEMMPVEMATMQLPSKEGTGASREGLTPRNDKEIQREDPRDAQVSEKATNYIANKRASSRESEIKLAFIPEESIKKSKDVPSFSEVRNMESGATSFSLPENKSVVFRGDESLPHGLPEESLASTEVKEDKKVPGATEKGASTDFLSELLKIEGQEAVALNAREDRKWSVGLNVSPNISGNNHVNLGGGVALAYVVSPKISISSGVSYLQLDAERGVSSPNMQNSPVSIESGAVSINVKNKTLEKVQANLVGLDIPLTLNYHVSKRIFTSVGISVFSVLHESGNLQYLNEMATMDYAFGDAKTPEPVVRTFSSKEALQEKMYEGKSVSGFFNFSVGYSIPLSKKVGFAIEPFFKIPMGYISPEELNLSNGGIKISTKF